MNFVPQCLLQAQGPEEDQSLKGSARGHCKAPSWHVSLCHYARGSRVYKADTWRPSGTWRHLGLKTGETEVQGHVTWEIELKLNLCFRCWEQRGWGTWSTSTKYVIATICNIIIEMAWHDNQLPNDNQVTSQSHEWDMNSPFLRASGHLDGGCQ